MLKVQSLAVAGAAAGLFVALAGCRTAGPRAVVRGTATYRERIALPPDAVFEATLEDVPRADAPAEVIGRTRIEAPGQVPISFEIAFDSARVEPSHRYRVRARITAGDQLMFTTDQAAPVITGGNPMTVSVLMRSAGKAPVSPALEGATWTLTHLGGNPVTLVEQQPVPDLTLDAAKKQAGGTSGCNRFTGGYQLDGERLAFGALASTRRMCVAGMELEQSYLAALGKVAGWRIEGGRLALLDADGAVVAQFTPLVQQ